MTLSLVWLMPTPGVGLSDWSSAVPVIGVTPPVRKADCDGGVHEDTGAKKSTLTSAAPPASGAGDVARLAFPATSTPRVKRLYRCGLPIAPTAAPSDAGT